MVAVMLLGMLLGMQTLLAILALRYGVDSRDGSIDPRRPLQPVGLR